MYCEHGGAAALDHHPCRYGTSRLVFRGPRRPLAGAQVVCLGGSETYGRFVARPWPVLLESALGGIVVNLGVMNAGADAFLADPLPAEAARGASVAVVQVTGAMNLSNPFYSVHPRHNDRFVRPTAALRRLCPRLDFTEFAFTRHLHAVLAHRAPAAHAEVVAALRQTWRERTAALLAAAGGQALLLWIEDAVQAAPLVSAAMVEAVAPGACGVVRLRPPADGTEGMVFPETAAPAAAALPGPAAHAAIAAALRPVLARRLAAAA